MGPRLAEALQAGERDQVMDALLDELQRPPPSTLVIEDVHWADEATVDTLRFWYAGSPSCRSFCCSPIATTSYRETTR